MGPALTILDTYALIAFLVAERPAATEVREMIRAGDAAVTTVNLAESVDVLQRRYGIERARARSASVSLTDGPLAVLAVDRAHALRAADLRAAHYDRNECAISLGDCVLLAAAGADDRVATADGAILAVAEREGIGAIALSPRS